LLDFEKIRSYRPDTVFSLKRVHEILSLLGNPHEKLEGIHIAGTKGKTSVSFYLDRLFRKYTNLKTGVYTSPHIKTPAERIRINGEMIREKKLDELFELVKNTGEENKLGLTYFEIMTAAGFLFFEMQETDMVLLETGLGGRLDATNVFTPLVSVITPIDLDHTKVLGKTRLKIAREKLGILKKGIPFFLAPQKFYIRLFCRWYGWKKGAPFKRSLRFAILPQKDGFLLKNRKYEIYFTGPGYGVRNFILAVSVFDFLGFEFPRKWDFCHDIPGRFERFSNGSGTVIFDGSHNPLSAGALKEELIRFYPGQKFCFIFNTFPDKDFKKMIRILRPLASDFIIPQRKELATEEIASFLRKERVAFRVLPEKEIPLVKGRNYCVTGSFYIMAEIRNKLGH
jgi:dihydrofolate synthase/folylpolyglutamate synthase